MKTTRILFYYTHKESLGHTTRVLSILKSLQRYAGPRVRLSVFHGGKEQKFLSVPRGIAWFNLPFPYYSRLNFKKGSSQYFVPFYAKVRANYMLSKIKEIKPDIFITEFFPFGREDSRFELLPILTYLKKNHVRICASIGYPYIVRGNIQLLLRHCDLYDQFYIHTPPDLEFRYLAKDIENPILKAMYTKTFRHISNRVHYTGYILPFGTEALIPAKRIRKDFIAEDKILVLVSRGGGVRYPKIIGSSILAAKILSDKYFFLMTAGPSSSRQEMKLFRSLIQKHKIKNVRLLQYLPDMPSYLKACDIAVNMSGYNTSVQLLYFKKHALLIPSQEDPETAAGYCSEQISRAKLLGDYLGNKVLDYHEFQAEDIARELKKMDLKRLPARAGEIKQSWFEGGQKTARWIIHGS